jgi:CRISPR-associated protein Cas2
MSAERLIIVTYDIRSPKRWRQVFKLMKGYGQWLQLSVFQCRLTEKRMLEMRIALEKRIKFQVDHVMLLDLGNADTVRPKITSLGMSYQPLEREAIII